MYIYVGFRLPPGTPFLSGYCWGNYVELAVLGGQDLHYCSECILPLNQSGREFNDFDGERIHAVRGSRISLKWTIIMKSNDFVTRNQGFPLDFSYDFQ